MSNAVRQLQNLVTDEAAVECHELFLSESKSSATGGTCSTAYDRLIPELIYQKKAEKLLADENCMKIFIVSVVGCLYSSIFLDLIANLLPCLRNRVTFQIVF